MNHNYYFLLIATLLLSTSSFSSERGSVSGGGANLSTTINCIFYAGKTDYYAFHIPQHESPNFFELSKYSFCESLECNMELWKTRSYEFLQESEAGKEVITEDISYKGHTASLLTVKTDNTSLPLDEIYKDMSKLEKLTYKSLIGTSDLYRASIVNPQRDIENLRGVCTKN